MTKQLANAAASSGGTGTALQRKCSCGQHTMGGSECESCQDPRKKLLQRSPHGTCGGDAAEHQAHVDGVLAAPGLSIPRNVRSGFESRFKQDFSGVVIHADQRAATSADALNADAYTVRNHIVFGSGLYAPGTTAGRGLLAHELTHVAQQRRWGAGSGPLTIDPSPGAERDAEAGERMAAPASADGFRSGSVLQRKLKVRKAGTPIPDPTGSGLKQSNGATVEGYLDKLCLGGNVKVDSGSGEVQISPSFCNPTAPPPRFVGPLALDAKSTKTKVGCGCVCDLAASANTWTIEVDDTKWPHTTPDDAAGAVGKKPGGTGGVVTAPSPNSPKLWGAETKSGKELDVGGWLVLGHELCGHAWMMNTGSHGPDEASPRGEGGHQETVKRENLIRGEQGIGERGGFKDPNCGESYWRDKASPTSVNWSSFRSDCEKWRQAYNKKNGTSYKITDTIP